MKNTLHTLHTAQLNNNCPECFSTDGLEISFTQSEAENFWYKKASSAIEENLYCHTCKHVIYPVNWNDDIERVYDYHKKRAVPKKQNLQLKLVTYLFLLVVIAVAAASIYFLK